MTIIVFLVDNSASMNQRTFMGTTLLDITKNSIETFQKIRAKNPNSKFDRLMLLTLDDPPYNIKAGWKETHTDFSNRLKNLQAVGTTSIGAGLKNAFDMLNMNRNQSGIDTYGQGRCPFYNEPAMIICLTDGGAMVTPNGVQKQLTIPMADGIIGSELTKEPFRWDQRFFSIILNFSAVDFSDQSNEQQGFIPQAENHPIDSMCDVTGGRSYLVSTHKQLSQTLDSLAQKASMNGVVVNIEYSDLPNGVDESKSRPVTPTQNTQWKCTKKMIYVKSSAQRGHSVGHWPVPEAYWPDSKAKNIPSRDAQPVIKFNTPVPPPAAHQMSLLPVDIYELEPSPLTQYVIKQSAGKNTQCYQTYIAQSSKYSEHPFGFLQANVTTSKVFLHVMPYNYPVLLNLVDEMHKTGVKVTPKWKSDFDNYLRAMPGYYAPYLRRALGRAGIHNVVPDSLDNCLSFSVVSHLKQVRIRAKQEYENLNSCVGQPTPTTQMINVTSLQSLSVIGREDFHEMFQGSGTDYAGMAAMQREVKQFNSFPIATPKPQNNYPTASNFKNPFDIPRDELLSQVAKLRAMLLQPGGAAGLQLRNEHLHNLPIADMGDYHKHLASAPAPLRKIDTAPERMHTFGNPFKVNKNLMIDEADEAVGLGGISPGSPAPKRSKRESAAESASRGRRRKPGPLPRHVSLTNRPSTPTLGRTTSSTPNSTPDISPVSTPNVTPNASPAPHRKNDLSPAASPMAAVNSDDPLEMDIELPKFEGKLMIDLNGHAEDIKPQLSPVSPTSPVNNRFTPKVLQHSLSSSNPEPQMNGIESSHNDEIILRIVREVKRPGKEWKGLLTDLDKLQGTKQEKLDIYTRVIYEAMRFKRDKMAKFIAKKRDALSSMKVINNLHKEAINGTRTPPSASSSRTS